MKNTCDQDRVIKDKFFAFLGSISLKPFTTAREHMYLAKSYGRNSLMLGWDHSAYNDVNCILSERYTSVSQKSVGREVMHSAVRLFERFNISEDADPECDAPHLESILETLDASIVQEELKTLQDILSSLIVPWTIFVPIEGLELGAPSLDFGPVTFYQTGQGPLIKFLECARAALSQKFFQAWDEITKECYSYAAVNIEGEKKYAIDQTIDITEKTLHVFKVHMVTSEDKNNLYKAVGPLGYSSWSRCLAALSCTPSIDVPGPRTYEMMLNSPQIRRYMVDPSQIIHWKEHGLQIMLDSISSSEWVPGGAENRIHNAIIWYGRAMNADTPDEQFVALTTALESLLVADDKVKITQRLADGVSAMLGTNYEHRESIRKEVTDLYNLRSRIVHQGVPISRASLIRLNVIVVKTIREFVQREVYES